QPVAACGEPLDGAREHLGELGIDLDGGHVRSGLEEAEGERAETGADLEDRGALLDSGGPDDPAHGARVDHEVLAEDLRGTDPLGFGQAADVGGGEQVHGHHPNSATSGRRFAVNRRPDGTPRPTWARVWRYDRISAGRASRSRRATGPSPN